MKSPTLAAMAMLFLLAASVSMVLGAPPSAPTSNPKQLVPYAVFDANGSLVGRVVGAASGMIAVAWQNGTELVLMNAAPGGLLADQIYYDQPGCTGGQYVPQVGSANATSFFTTRNVVRNPNGTSSLHVGGTTTVTVAIRSTFQPDGAGGWSCQTTSGTVPLVPFVPGPLPFVPPYTLK